MKQKILNFILSVVMISSVLTACGNRENTFSPETTATATSIFEEPPETSAETSAEMANPGTSEPASIKPAIIETDLSSYFGGHDASAVFFNADRRIYEIYNLEDAGKRYSPCSTFKITSSLAALEYGVITAEDSLRKWSGEQFWNEAWNKNITLPEAFKTSCIWYYRKIIDEIGATNMQTFLAQLQYGNQDISDWEGQLNKNNSNRALTGFWVESSLMISPIEQVDLLCRVFENQTGCSPRNVEILKEIMKVDQTETNIDIYGKTGYGRLKNVSLDSWFVGMFEVNSETNYFAVHFSETEDLSVTSALAKEVALQIIDDRYAQ